MKTYNTLSNAFSLAQTDNGNPGVWSSEECSNGDCADFADKFFAPYLKIAKTCDANNYQECLGDELNALGDGSSAKSKADEIKEETIDDISRAFLLQDGSALFIADYYPWTNSQGQSGCDMSFYVDTNGPKEPNKIGRDIFLLLLADSYKGGVIVGSNTYTKETVTEAYGVNYANCDPSEPNSDGSGCADRLLKEGKMDY